MGHLTSTNSGAETTWSCNGWQGRSVLMLVVILAGIGGILAAFAWNWVHPALGQLFGPAQDGWLAWGEWVFLQVMAGNLVTLLGIGLCMLLLALVMVSGAAVRTTCASGQHGLLCRYFILGAEVAQLQLPWQDVQRFDSFLVGSPGGYKITADLREEATDPPVTGWLSGFVAARRAGGDQREPRRLLVLAALTDEATADRVVRELERLRTCSTVDG